MRMKSDWDRLTKAVYVKMKENRIALLAVAVLVVFVTTYLLVLPALTLDEEEAREQGGISLSETQEAGASESTKPTAQESEQADEPEKSDGQKDSSGQKSGAGQKDSAGQKAGSQKDADPGRDAGLSSENGESQTIAEEDLTAAGLKFEGDGYQVTALCDASAEVPAGTEITATEIRKADDEDAYKDYYKKALKAVRKDAEENQAPGSKAKGKNLIASLKYAHFYDITLSADGTEIEPADAVSVSIAFDEALKVADPEHVKILHFAEDPETGKVSTEVLAAEDVDLTLKKNKMTEAAFQAPGFSVYAIVYTVDFHYEVNGEKLQYSIPGGGFISFSELVKTIGVSDNPKEFVSEIERIEFSNPEFVWCEKVEDKTTVGALKEKNGLKVQYTAEMTEEQIAEINAQTLETGDWALISLQPFTSEEILTVTMKNGDQWTVRVTDAQKPYKDVDTLENGTYIIYRSDGSNSRYMFLKNDGTTAIKRPANGEALSSSDFSAYTWAVTKNSDGSYTIKSTNSDRYISLTEGKDIVDRWSKTSWNPISVNLSGNNGIAIAHNGYVLKRNDNGFYYNTGTGVGLTFYKIENDSSGSTSHDTGIELTDEEREELSKWEETIEKFNTLTDYNKTAEQFDYDNRIYKINISADSGIMDFYKDVDLGFVLDVSNSMKFPSSLKALEDENGNDQQVWMTAEWLNWARSEYSDYYNKQNCFYVLSDPALTSTIYRVFKDGSKWKYQDASSTDPSKIYEVNNGTTFKEPFRQAYTLYYADDQTQRIEYLNSSVAQAVETLKKIVQPTQGADDETANVRIAYNFFAGTKTSSDGNITQYAIRGSHDFVDLRSQESRTFEVKPKGNEADGTRQDLALFESNNDPNLAANEFSWNSRSDVDRYVILVTDGAPNGASMSDVENAARRLKAEDNVKVITIGLSTKDVDGGSTLLKTIADDVDGDETKDFYEAEKASDLKHILMKILQTLMTKGLVRGKITDTIDPGFYPVDTQGNPLEVGVYKNGQRIPNAQMNDYVFNGKPTNAHENEAFYTWEQVDGKWKITWYNQEIGWDDNDTTTGNPWTGTVYVKAKEDYLGGNLIETNDGNAQIEPTGIKLVINGYPEANWRPLQWDDPIKLPVPRVNVHNLETKENLTTWTVYKGTSITPKEQIEALWNNIPIEEVVSSSEDGQHKRTTGAAANVGNNGKGETFSLGNLISEVAPSFNIDSLIDQITTSKSSASTDFEYNAYGHNSGKITVTVSRTIGNQTTETHPANEVGKSVEQYEVTFTYKPYTEAERMNGKVKDSSDTNHHNGPNGRGAEETGKIESTNTHEIDVIKKALRIKKTDMSDTLLTDTAEFTLYRKAVSGETSTVHLSNISGLEDGDYVAVTQSTNAGYAIFDPIYPIKDADGTYKRQSTDFWLVETSSPAAYTEMPGAIKITLRLTDTITQKPIGQTDTGLYDWNQSVSITTEAVAGAATFFVAPSSTEVETIEFTIKNDKDTEITIIKVDATDNSKMLSGAKFKLIRGSEVVTDATITSLAAGNGVIALDEENCFELPKEGVKVSGLKTGDYTLIESAPPVGYIITDQPLTFKAGSGTVTDRSDGVNTNAVVFRVPNEPGKPLPMTGGPGTMGFVLGGVLLMLACGMVLVVRRRIA